VSATDQQGRTPLHAAAKNHEAAMKVLLAAGASVDAADNDGCTALHIAATSSMQSAPTVKFLLMRRATVDAVDTGCRTPLHHAIAAGRSAAVSALITGGASVSAADNSGWTALHVAAAQQPSRSNNPAVIQKNLLAAGAAVNAADKAGRT
jgi:ankyrin repeat protein